MRKLTPQMIADESIGMFIERLEAITITDEVSEDDAWDLARAQAVQEADGYEIVLPDEVLVAQAAHALLKVCQALASDLEGGLWTFGQFMEHLNKLRDMARAAIALTVPRIASKEWVPKDL